MIIINITKDTTICRANNTNINSISNIKKSVVNTHPTIQTRSDITTIAAKNDINPLIYYKYNKFTILVILSISAFSQLLRIVPSRILPKTLDFIKIIIILFAIQGLLLSESIQEYGLRSCHHTMLQYPQRMIMAFEMPMDYR